MKMKKRVGWIGLTMVGVADDDKGEVVVRGQPDPGRYCV
jgi:hypothetical protein